MTGAFSVPGRVVRGGRGRPTVDRLAVLCWLLKRPGGRRGMVRLNARVAAAQFQCHRVTVQRAVNDLQEMGLVERRRAAGRSGLVLRLTEHGRLIAEFSLRMTAEG